MEMAKLGLLLLLLLLSDVFSQETELETWRREPEETKWPNSEDLQRVLVRMTRKPRQCRCFTGRTGRKPISKTQTAGKRIGNTFHTFVGLMGKRNQGAPKIPV